MTQYEKIITIMLDNPSKWYHAEDLMSNADVFVGYKAQARISELAIDYPEMIDRQPSIKGNRQHQYRFRADNTAEFLPMLPAKLARFVKETMKQKGLKVYKRMSHVEVKNGIAHETYKVKEI